MKLHLPEGLVFEIANVEQLGAALSSLAHIPEGGVVELKESNIHTIRAERDDAYWIVTAKPRGWWFRQTLTTGDWLDTSKRKPKAIWVARGNLSDAQVKKVFLEFFQGKKFSQPIVGAG